jgi:hypothetical protein
MADAAFAASPKVLTPSSLREADDTAEFTAPPAPPVTYCPSASGALPLPSLLQEPEPEPEPERVIETYTETQATEDYDSGDDGSWTPDDEPVLLRFGLSAGHAVDLDALEQRFESAVAKLLGCARDRIAWVDADNSGEGGCAISFCIYAAEEDEAPVDGAPLPSCAALGDALMDLCARTPERLESVELAELAGAPLSNITDVEEEEWEEEIDEGAAMELMLGCEPPLAIVRRLFHRRPVPPPAASSPKPEEDEEPLTVLSPEHLSALYEDGFCVVDSALDPATAVAAGLEALDRESSTTGGFMQAGLAGHDAKVRDDRTLFLHPEQCQGDASGDQEAAAKAAAAAAGAAALDRAVAVMGAVHRDVASAIRLKHGASRPELQLAVYRGAPPTPRGTTPGQGARYERHRDGFPSAGDEEDEAAAEGPMWRRVTSILYLNEQPWPLTQGGALRVYRPRSDDAGVAGSVEQHQEGEGGWVDVAPEGGRLVVFMAGAVEHEVLPAYAPRVALTAWFS